MTRNQNAAPTNSHSRYLYLAVFTSGMTTLAVELSASRLLGNVFGTSNLVWANVIGLILLYLTVGYFIGGRWADRSPYPTIFYRIMLWAAFLSALIPLAARPVLRTAASAVVGAEAALALGSFASVIILFAVPVTLLGCVSPFAIRLAVHGINDSGKVAGQIYAVSTLGSLVGTFIPVLFLIPELGTFRTFLLFSAILYTVSLIGLWMHQGVSALRYLWMPVVVAILAALVLSGPLRPTPANTTLLYEKDSAYNYIQVVEDQAGYRYLYLNEGQGIHSQWHPDIYAYRRTWSFFLTAPYFNDPPYQPENLQNMAIIGLAGGTIARQHFQVYGDDLTIDGIEIDPDVIEAGALYFDMNPTRMPGLNSYAQDGRYMLNRLHRQYDFIAIDAYRPPYIPWHLTTVEFFQETRDRLTEQGVVAINVGRTNTDRRLVDALTATLLQVFPSVHAMDVPLSFNTILIATQYPTTPDNLLQNLNALSSDVDAILRDALLLGSQHLTPAVPSDLIFTDDLAPVETLVDSLVLNFLFAGGADQLRTDN